MVNSKDFFAFNFNKLAHSRWYHFCDLNWGMLTKFLSLIILITISLASYAQNVDQNFAENIFSRPVLFQKDGQWSPHAIPDDIDEYLEKEDKKSNTDWREDIPDSIRLASGAQIHKSCYEAAKSYRHLGRDPYKDLEIALKTAATNILRCKAAYPELSPYISEWISTYRRHFFRCDLKDKSTTKFAAENDLNDNTLIGYSMVGSLLNRNQDFGFIEAQATILHEIFHSTSANNRYDHNHIQKKEFDHKISCKEDSSFDRIVLLKSLCSGSLMNASNMNARKALALKAAKCGHNHACRNTFSGKNSNIDWYKKIFDRDASQELLNDKESISLCKKIQIDGMCLHLRETQGKAIMASSAQIKKLHSQMKKKFQQFFPHSTNHIPLSILRLYPDIMQTFQKYQNTHSFKVLLKKLPHQKGFYAIRGPMKSVESFVDLKAHFSTIHDNLSKAAKQFKLDQKYPEPTNEILAAISALTKDTAMTVNLNQILKLLGPFLKDIREFTYYEKSTTLGYKNPHSPMHQILGDKLFVKWQKIMNTYHPDSPYFSCKAAGLPTRNK